MVKTQPEEEKDSLDDKNEDSLIPLPGVGDSVEVYWPLDESYYPGNVSSINEGENKYHIEYNGGNKEDINMSDEI